MQKSCGFFIGDIRDQGRLELALNGVDYVVHAAAMKQVPACEYNPIEAIKTNIDGATNVINAVLKSDVKKVVALSTDKAVNPINLYGGTKLVSDKLFVAANAYRGVSGCTFSVVRYGNVAGNRGSVIPFFDNIIKNGGSELPITDYNMTRFWIDLEESVKLVLKAIAESRGGETFISKIPSFKVTDLAQAMFPGCKMPEVGIREGEKLHEVMITQEDLLHTYEYEKHFIIYPSLSWWKNTTIIPGWIPLTLTKEYSSEKNKEMLSAEDLKKMLSELKNSY